MDSDSEDIEEFSGIEQPPLLEQIKRILDEYRNDVQIIKELIQNADDAEATSMKILYEGKTINPEEEGESEYRQFLRAPALVFYNDAKFTEDDWRGIRSIYTSVKRDDPLKIGRFGLGFKSVFHLTDFPCIISGDNAMFINPHAKEFGKICVTVKLINLGKWKRLNYGDYQNSLMGTFGFSEQTLHEGRYEGTMFWFPLRQVASTLSDNVYPEDKVTHLLQAFLNESNRSLLFLKTLCSIHLHIDVQESSLEEIRTRDGSTRTLMQMSLGKDKDCFSVEVNNETSDLLNIRKDFLKELKDIGIDIPDHSKHWVFCINVKSVTNSLNENAKVAKARWLVVNYLKGGEISEKTKELMSDKELGYPHVVSVAAPIKEDGEYINTAGHVFCYQPLPQETASMTGLPVHINAFFALGQNRRQVRWPDQGDLTNGEGDKKIEWNIALRSEILPHAYVTLIEEMITLCKDGNCQEYLLKGVYNTIPNFSVVDEHWTDLAERVMELSKGSSILYTELNGGKWIAVQQAVFTTFHSNPEYKEYQKTVYDLLIEDEINLVTVPQYVIEALHRVCNSHTEVTPAFLRSHLEDNFRYKELNRDSKMDLLEFVCLDTSRTHLENLELLPLQDGAFATFRQDKSVFKESKEVIELFPGKESSFVHGCCRQKTEKVLTELLEEGEFCLENLNTDSVVNMTTDVLGDNFDDIGDTIVCTSDVETWKKWTSGIWHLIQGKFRKSIQRFSDIPIFPLVSDSKWEKTGEFTLLKLTSPLLYVPSLDEFADKENISRAFHLLSVRLIQFIPDCIDIEVVRQFLHEETSESLTELFDRINDVERYNIECAVDDSEIFLKFLSERIHTKLGNVGSETLRHLKIFRGYQSASESQLVSLAQTHDIYEGTHFPVRFPKEVILVKSDQERTFASHLGANSVSELELVRITLRNIGEYDPHERQIFIKWLISNVAHFGYHDVQDRLKEVDFLEATDGSFHKVGDLFDPSNKELCDLFRNEHVFPKVNIENEQQFLNGLRQLGLKTICDITSVDIESICCKIHEMAFGNSAFDDTMCRALLHVTNKSGDLVDKSRVHDKKCILIEDMVMVDNFPQFIPLKNKEIGVPMLLCRPDEIKSIKFLNLIGSVVHVVDCKNLKTLSAIFEWETSPAIENVIEHLFNVVQHYKPEYKADCIPIITSIYNHLSDADRCRMSEVRELIQSQFKAPLDAFVWDGNAFQSIHNVYAEIAKGDIDMKPFLHPLPVEIKHMSSFFVSLGCPESLDLDMYLATLGRIKDSEKNTNGDENLSDAFTDMAVSILNKLKKNFLQELRDREIQLFFPTLNENGGLRMLPADCCTYCDEQWLKNMDFQFDDDVHYVHPDLPLATADALGVPSLRQQMMSDTEAFEEWGQEEPLTRRLRNLLKEGYVDGFCVAKELFQNADDARARKLWIMYDERENNDAKSQLISEGMADCQGPAIWVYNDEQFTEGDFKNITKLSGATKEEDSTKIGKFGLGFCAVYNITDVPSFLSGENFIIFDPDMSHLGKVLPGRSPGLRINFRVMKNLKMIKSLKNQFMPFENVFGCKIADESSPCFNGTLFRLPLRNRASDICDVVYSPSEVKQLFGKIMSMAANMFLFNQNVTEFKLFHLPKTERNPCKATLLYEINKTSARLMPSVDMNVDIIPVLVETTRRKQAKSLHDKPLRVVDRISVRITNYTDSNFQVLESKTDSCVDWLVSWSSGTHETTLRLAYEDKGALPLAAVAIPVSYERSGISSIPEIKVIPFKSVQDQFYQKGHLFFFLPLPIQHRFLFHINSQFTITTDRRQLKTSTEDDKNTKMKEWNKYLMKDSVANALLNLLENLHEFGTLTNYQYDSLWPKSETTEILEYLPHAFYQKLVQPEHYSVFERDGQWFDISKCVFIERTFRNSDVGDIAFEFLSQLTEFVVDVSEEKYNMLRQADQSSIDEKTVTKESFFLDFFFPHLEDFSSDKSMLDKRKKLLYFAVELQDMTINQWLRTNKCIPSQPYGNLKRPNELVDLNSTLAALFVASDGLFPESPFTHRNILEKLRNLGIMWNVLDDDLIKDRACSIEHLSRRCSVCAIERADHVIGYLSDNISNHGSIIPDLQSIKFLPIQPKPQTWPFDWHADIFASSKSSKKCKTHRKLDTAYETTCFDRASNMFYSDCKNIIGCVAFVFDKSSFFKCNTVSKSTPLRTMLKALGMNGIANGDVDVRFVLNQVDCISVSYKVSSNSSYFTTAYQIMREIYKHLDAACESRNIFDFVAEETKDKSFVLVREAFISPKRISQNCYDGCKPYLFNLIESPLSLCSTLCKCLDIKDNFPPYEVALILQNVKQEKMNTPLHQSEIQTMINILFCLRKSIYAIHGKDFEVQSIVNKDLVAIYGPDENGILRDCKSMCFNDYDDIEKDESMMYAHDSFSPSLAKYFGVKPKLVHNLEQSSEDIEDFYQEEPLVTRLNRLVDGYPCDSGIFKELIQNADDAEATEIHFVIDYTTHPSYNIIDPRFAQLQGPALLVYNNSAFSNDDLKGITKLGRGSKSDDPSQTGRYGVGFNAVYNLTDAPSFYTKGGDIENGETLCFFDPLAKYIPNVTRKKPGKRYKNVKNIRRFHRSMMDGYHENILMTKKTGTIFRFPLRTKTMAEVSEIKREAVEIDTLSTLLKSFEKELCNVILFLKYLTTVKISTCRQGAFVEEFCIDVSMISAYAEARKSFVQQQNQLCRTFSKNKEDIFKFKQYTAIYELSMNVRAAGMNTDQYDYLIVQTLGFDENKPVHSLIRKALVNGKLGLLPHGGVALRVRERPMSAGMKMWEVGKNCKAFCFLPLPIETGLPVHIHGYFALDHETRRTLWRSEDFEKCYRSLWNRTLVEQVISRAYVFLLEYTKGIQFKGISDGKFSKTTATYNKLSNTISTERYFN